MMLLLSDQVVVILLVIPRPLLPRPLPPPGSPLLPLVILTVRLLLEHKLKNLHLISSTFGIGLSDLHGGVHKQDEYGHGVDGHEVAHGAPALLLARGLARLTPRVHTRHGPHARHRALGTQYHYHYYLIF